MKPYKFWMLNLIVLHTAYMIGQCDLIPTFFIVASLYAGLKSRPYSSVSLLSLGGATKFFPYFLVLPACLMLGDDWRKRFKLILTALTIFLLTPGFLTNPNQSLALGQCSNKIRLIMMSVFALGYFLICIRAVVDKGWSLTLCFLTTSFLVYACMIVPRLRFLVYVSPCVVLIAPYQKRFALFFIFIAGLMAFTGCTTRALQLGLFAPLNPALMDLPTIQEFLFQSLSEGTITIIYKVLYRVQLLSLFIAFGWAWMMEK